MAFPTGRGGTWALPEREEPFRALADHMAQLVWIMDADGSIHWCNLRWSEYTGASLQGIQGLGWTRLCHPDHAERVTAAIHRSLQTGEPWEDVFPLRGKDGRYRWFLAQVLPLRDERDRIVQWLGTATDVTERRWIDQLHEAERQVLEMVTRGEPLALVLETLTEMIEELTDEGLAASILLLDEDGLHLHHGAAPHLPAAYNRAIEGLSIGERAGSCGTAAYRREMVVVSDIASDPLWAEYRDLALPHGLRACWSTPIIGGDGRVLGTFAIYHREPSSPRPEHLRLVELVSRTAAIILERYRTEALRSRLQRLQKELTAMVVHDLRSPLTGITLSAELLQRQGMYKPELVDRILAGTGQLQRLIDDLLDASRVDAGRLPLERTRFDLVGEVRKAVEQFQAQTTTHTLRLDAPDWPLVGDWDPGRVGQVLANLLSNAIKYAPDGGEITVSITDDGNGARVSVRDRGLGIAPEHLSHVFERFYRVEDTVAAARSLGLGLYITKGIVEAHGGRLVAESAGPGKGSTFTFTLPYTADTRNEVTGTADERS